MNRLAESRSPYLLQHKDNPVDWWPWEPAAFEEAKRRDVPVMISVGYASCHWCHVMAHESFEDPETAAIVNANTVPVKVDREERPDVDAVYMAATQAMTGHGGWPMTVFATPDGQPFYCGTYFPRSQFVQLVAAVAQAWRDQREAVLRQGKAVVEHVAGAQARTTSTTPLTADILDAAAQQLRREFDTVHGGFGDAPKFPPHMNLLFLLRQYQRTGDEGSLEIVRHTCEQMARGGIYDQLTGGFARYSVDGHWTVPHFEKMLYDNALLLRVYTHLARLTGDRLAQRVSAETAEFLLSGLSTPEGGFASGLDADTDGVEGATYAWTPAQIADDWAADLLGVTQAGTFEHGTSVLRMARDIDDADEATRERWRRTRAALKRQRDTRPQPQRDDKVVAAWTGLAVTALAEYGALTGDPQATTAAIEAARLLQQHIVDGRLRRVSRDGVPGQPLGVLEDYGCVAEAFCAVHQITGDGAWLTAAGQLLDTALAEFATGDGGFFDTAADAERLIARPADPTDNATPSGLSAVAAALTTYTALSGETRYREAAERALATIAPIAARHARFTGYACAVGEALVSGPYEIAIVGADTELLRTAINNAPPGAVIVHGEPDQPGVPLLAGRTLRGAAYVCRGFVCDRPVTTPEDLATQLR